MDRYLISGVFGLLILQILFLLHNLGIIDPLHLLSKGPTGDRQVIGKVIKKRQSVKRKSVDSIIWEDSSQNDALYRFDSVLTLDNSTAQLSVEDNVNLQIHENTLVVLEPIDQRQDESLRVRFYKGQLRSSNRRGLQFGAGGWSMEAAPGTDLSLRALSDDRVELEISEGEVSLANKQSGEKQTLTNGKKLILGKDKVEASREVSESLQIKEPRQPRIYSHHFPLFVPMSWTGAAVKLHLLYPDRREQSISVNGNSAQLFFPPGTFSITLEDKEGRLSPSHTLEIIPAPRVRYLSPLPRDRIETGLSRMFSWYPLESASEYEIRIDGQKESKKQKSKMPYAQVEPLSAGEYNWSVYAFDADGVEISPFYSLPVYFTPSPLAAPKLLDPTRSLERRPAEEAGPVEKHPSPDGASLLRRVLEKAYSLLISEVAAETLLRPILFSWLPVPGADYYIIEISSTSDFMNPEVIREIKKEEFAWDSYKKKNYYWRVAAGAKGRMGVFSEPASFHVAKLSEKMPGDLGPGFKVLAKKVEAAPPPPAPPPPEPAAEPKKQVSTYIEVSALADYWVMSQKNSDVKSVEFKGLALPSFSLEKSWNIASNTYVTNLSFHQLEWEARDPLVLPFQPSFTTQLLTLKIYELGENPLHFGAVIKQIPIVEREALEEVQARDVVVYGFLTDWRKPASEFSEWRTQFSLAYGDKFVVPSLGTEWRYLMGSRTHFSGLAEIAGAFGGDNSHTSQWMRLGFEFGFRW